MGFLIPDRSQQHLFGYSLEEFVPQDNKCRFIVNIVEHLDLRELDSRYSSQGGDTFQPAAMLAAWFYGYTEGETRTRKLENLCKYDLRFIYVSGNLRPDHTSLSRFRKKNLDLMEEYFVQIVKFAMNAGISDFSGVNIDGTKMKASCSAKQSYTEEGLKKKLDRVRKDIAEYLSRCDLAEEDDMNIVDIDRIHSEKERLEKLEQRLLERQEQLKIRKQGLKSEHRKNHKINLVEPDARFMPKADGPSYNVQAAAIRENNFIVANDVTTDPNDQNQFKNIHQNVETNIGSDSKRKYNADSGYHSLNQLEYIEENDIDAIVAEPTPQHRSNKNSPSRIETLLKEKRKVERSDFVFHENQDIYQCPFGDQLRPAGKNGQIKLYRASRCHECPLVSQCLPKKNKLGLKTIYRNNNEYLAEKMFNKLQSDDAKSRLKERATTIEPAIGNFKQNLGFRRFTLRGLAPVKGEFNLICVAHNLNILHRYSLNNRLTLAALAQKFSYKKYSEMSKNKLFVLIQNVSILLRILLFGDFSYVY